MTSTGGAPEISEFIPRKASIIPNVDEGNTDGEPSRNKLLRILDDIEDRVGRFRRGALLMEEEKDSLISSIDAVRGSELLTDLIEVEREEIMHYTERISSQCSTVDIAVRTVRNELQEESLNQVNTYIDSLVLDMHGDPCVVKERCMTYMAACLPEPEANRKIDKRFECALLGCSLDDQKRIRKRLQGLLSYIDNMFKMCSAVE